LQQLILGSFNTEKQKEISRRGQFNIPALPQLSEINRFLLLLLSKSSSSFPDASQIDYSSSVPGTFSDPIFFFPS